MVTPVDSGMSVYNADHMANQVRDPNATHAMGAQQIDVRRENEQMSQTVQAAAETDAFIKIGDQPKEREQRRGGQGGSKRGRGPEDDGAEEQGRTPATSRGFSFIG